jgi:threonine dehydratase
VPVSLKLESDLPTGSFNPRGALHALATRLERARVPEVVASSTGNHGAAVAWAAKTLGVPATIFLPERPNPVKRAKIAALGAKIVEEGNIDLAGAARAARAHAANTDAYFLDDATDADLPAGPATIALEILDEAPDTQCIYVPVGDSALIRGVAAEAKRRSPDIRIVAVQAANAPSYYLSWRAGTVVGTDTCNTIADGLATRTPEAYNVEMMRTLVDDVVLVTEEQMLDAVRRLLLDEHRVSEASGAATTAAALAHPPTHGRVVLVLSGANISPDVLARAATLTP